MTIPSGLISRAEAARIVEMVVEEAQALALKGMNDVARSAWLAGFKAGIAAVRNVEAAVERIDPDLVADKAGVS